MLRLLRADNLAELEERRLFNGRLAWIPGLVEGDDPLICTPSNIWPQDRSWFVYTDWDLLGTKVSGSRELVAALDASPDLETCIRRGRGLLEGWSRFT